jgi:nitroimidazol reductase NimA-like FMN-containing flavoprotein (pyridoxamine 5'-phosphate oxidase superfamily)
VSYGFDGRFLYLASGPGRKRGNLETSSPVCVTVVEVRDGDRWSSVVITGEAVRVNDFGGKLRALAAIRRQRATGGPPSAVDLARIARAAVFRIDPVEVTGRARGPVL